MTVSPSIRTALIAVDCCLLLLIAVYRCLLLLTFHCFWRVFDIYSDMTALRIIDNVSWVRSHVWIAFAPRCVAQQPSVIAYIPLWQHQVWWWATSYFIRTYKYIRTSARHRLPQYGWTVLYPSSCFFVVSSEEWCLMFDLARDFVTFCYVSCNTYPYMRIVLSFRYVRRVQHLRRVVLLRSNFQNNTGQ